MSHFADSFRLNIRKVLAYNIKQLTRRTSFLGRHNREARRVIEREMNAKNGNEFRIELPGGLLKAGSGKLLKRSSMYKRHMDITVDGWYNVGIDVSACDLTTEINPSEVRTMFGMSAGEAFANIIEDRFSRELAMAEHFVPYDPADPGRTFQEAYWRLKRNGLLEGRNPAFAGNDNLLQSLEYMRFNAKREESVGEFSGRFDVMESVNRLPDYTTGDRAGLCPVVCGPCQSGCELFIYVDGATPGQVIAHAGESLEICGVDGVVPKSQSKTGRRRQFYVECDVVVGNNGLAAVKIWPHLRPQNVNVQIGENKVGQKIFTDAEANVTAYPKDGALVQFSPGLEPNSVYEQSVAWNDRFIVPAAKRIPKLDGFSFSESMPIRVDQGNGVQTLATMSYTIDGNIESLDSTHRMDVSMDVIALERDNAVKIVGPKVADC